MYFNDFFLHDISEFIFILKQMVFCLQKRSEYTWSPQQFSAPAAITERASL